MRTTEIATRILPENGDEADWAALRRSEWDSSRSAYNMARTARRIIDRGRLTLAAFASQCRQRGVRG